MQKQLPAPLYKDVSAVGMPHERTFYVSVQVGDLMETGKGRNKKLAKHDAAEKLLTRLNALPVDELLELGVAPRTASTSTTDTNQKKTAPESDSLNCNAAAAALPTDTKETPESYLVPKIAVDGEKVGFKELQCMDFDHEVPSYHHVTLLDLIASDEEYEIKFNWLSELEEQGVRYFQSLVVISTSPEMSAIGKGKTEDEAKYAAAFLLLQQMKATLLTSNR
ncbi:unnamed protein product [Soboliphyme baturini]|uniref:DRBM domain-containing protein n=1 Tax=Soboliphyme baturini TaxID=241478 RepID=A0A183J600_9BILA|nr:unnamed protein product [Soboliphyme baturini]